MITKVIDDKTFTFRLPTIGQLDRYFGKVGKSLVTSSVMLATDMASPEQKDEVAAILNERPGLAVEVATEGLKGRGFNTTGEAQD